MALRQVGSEGYARMIGQDIKLVEHLHGLAEGHPELEAMALGLSVSVFRFVPKELADRVGRPETEEVLDELNKEIQDRMERGGEAFLSNAVIQGRYALRACVVNFNTTRADVEAVPEIVARVGREVYLEWAGRPGGTG